MAITEMVSSIKILDNNLKKKAIYIELLITCTSKDGK